MFVLREVRRRRYLGLRRGDRAFVYMDLFYEVDGDRDGRFC